MATSLGSLVVSLGLDAAEFVTGLTVAEKKAQDFARKLDRGIAAAATVAGAAMVGLGAAALGAVAAINRLAEQAGHFQDLAEKTGASAEAIAGFSVALQVTNKSADDLGDFMVKLSKNMAGVEDGTDKAGAALIALGINIRDFKKLDPAAQVEELSKALAKFSDQGGGKAAAMEAIAKGGANLLPFLKELNEAGGRQNILTKEQIAQADAYSDALARSKAQLNSYAQIVAIATIPAIDALVKASKVFLEDLAGIDKATKDLGSNNAVAEWADKAAKAIGFLADAIDGVTRLFLIAGKTFAAAGAQVEAATGGGMFGVAKALITGQGGAEIVGKMLTGGGIKNAIEVGKAYQDDVEEILNRRLFSTRLAEQIANRDKGKTFSFFSVTPAAKPPLKFEGADKADTVGKSILDGQIKSLENAIQREKDLLRARESFLQDAFSEGLLGAQHYYEQLQAARNEELARVLAFYDREIEATQAFQRRAKTANERQQAADKISDIQDKQQRIIAQAQFDEEKQARDRDRNMREYGEALDDIKAKTLELAGATREAAAIRFDAQNRKFTATAKDVGDEASQEALRRNEALKEQQGILLDLGIAQQKYSNSLETVNVAAARIDFQRSTGALTEIEALNKRSALARANIDTLNSEIDAYQKLAEAIKNPEARAKALNDIAAMRLEIDKLAASSDLLAKKFNDAFADATADTIFKLTTGMESLTDAVKDFEKQLIASISRIAAQNIAEQIFKPLSAGGTAGSGFDIGSIFAKLFSGSIPGLASGGDVVPGKTIAVGEKGVELFIPKVAGTIVPNSTLTSRRAARAGNTTLNINVLPGATRASADQAASAMARALQRANARES